jgi:cation transport ATPase
VKGAAALEGLGETRSVLLDKTGTVTLGAPEVERVAVLDGLPEAEVLRLAASSTSSRCTPSRRRSCTRRRPVGLR